MNSINVLSLNVGMSSTLAGLRALISSNDFHLIFLQEVKNTDADLNMFLQNLGFHIVLNVDTEMSSKPGTAVIWKDSLKVDNVLNLVKFRAQAVVLGSCVFFNIYGPSGSDKRRERYHFFSHEVFEALLMFPGSRFVLSGDFNCITSPLDVENGTGFSQKNCHALKDLISAYNLKDGFRIHNPRAKEFTFFRPGKAASRIDRFYIPSEFSENASVSHVASLSDHFGVTLKLHLSVNFISCPKIGRTTYWKLNTAILQEDDFLPSFKLFWKNICKTKSLYNNITEWWDIVAKVEIKQFCIGFSKQRKHKRADTMSFLLSYLKVVSIDKNWTEVARIKEEIKKMILQDSMGIVVRSRYQQISEEEKGSIFYAAREIKNSRNNISALKVNESIVKDRKIIEATVTTFFTSLFNGHHNSKLENTGASFVPDYSGVDEFLNGIGVMSDSESQEMIHDISMEELEETLKKCKNNKSPGLDGFPYELYKVTWSVIKEDLKTVLQEQLDQCAILKSNKIGATRLAPKIQGVPQVDELRPITLLNTDYKILSKILVKRIRPVLHSVIKSGQLCTVGDRNILFGVNNILSSLLYVKSKRQKACLLSLDFFKAYDRVLVDYLLRVMEKMNFSPVFCKWISMMHSGAQTKFILEALSEAIQVQFSIRQGDPLSMVLYIIYIEPLLMYLERTLSGLKIEGISQTIEAYCDDVNVLTDCLEGLPKVDIAVRKFEAFSGAILSRSQKCKLLGLGAWKSKVNWPLKYVQVVSEIKVFGIFIRDSYRALIKQNWDYRFDKFHSSVISWSLRRFPSVYSKVQILNTFALTRVYFVASILPVTKTIVKKFEKVMGTFVWKSSGWFFRVSMEDIKNDIGRGGLNLVCLETMCNSLLLSQFLRLLKSTDKKALSHIAYWIRDTVCDLLPSLVNITPQAGKIPEHFVKLEALKVTAKVNGIISSNHWKSVTNKIIYRHYAQGFPDCKIQRDSEWNYSRVWKLIHAAAFTSYERERSYMLVHNKLTTPERMFRIGVRNDPYCYVCHDALICDAEHVFCCCESVIEVWTELRQIIIIMTGQSMSNWKLINYMWPSCNNDLELTWLMGNYITQVWLAHQANSFVKKEEFFGYLRFKFKADQLGSRRTMNPIPWLNQ